jgi:hypothetical protein
MSAFHKRMRILPSYHMACRSVHWAAKTYELRKELMKTDWLTEDDIALEERSVIMLALITAFIFVASFASLLAVPVLPLHVHKPLAAVPSFPSSSAASLGGLK